MLLTGKGSNMLPQSKEWFMLIKVIVTRMFKWLQRPIIFTFVPLRKII
jgi:hypothetical protein